MFLLYFIIAVVLGSIIIYVLSSRKKIGLPKYPYEFKPNQPRLIDKKAQTGYAELRVAGVEREEWLGLERIWGYPVNTEVNTDAFYPEPHKDAGILVYCNVPIGKYKTSVIRGVRGKSIDIDEIEYPNIDNEEIRRLSLQIDAYEKMQNSLKKVMAKQRINMANDENRKAMLKVFSDIQQVIDKKTLPTDETNEKKVK